ncbi:metallophosphoesterase [Alcaligenes sp. DN25]|uniref:metallophosphoesterase family protein n=1 Tax=Alcaligenes TaxID=507 RepID=UPI00202EB4AF|nr:MULTISPECIES: metallophosphoesterase family protein [Alcaligenes]URW82167.1 metallophosphoesterase [Alcaligenes sp. DN25]WEA66988.1 metallophosphoesterase family protein [Alcaligenes faecalis]
MRLFVISDLHLGGRPHTDSAAMGSQICQAYLELTSFIDWVREQAQGAGSVELVINGDIVDFLMEDDCDDSEAASPWTPDESLVLKKLKLIINRTKSDTEYGPFDAMAALLAAGQNLTFLLGNHDIELSLPAVRRYLEYELGGAGRFKFIYDGEAYVKGDLLIEHGNRYDSWNIIDHSALRQERSMLSRGLGGRMQQRTSGSFTPPPGSFMVIKVINEIKRKYRFVDLLKPETEAVLPILLALHPKLQHALQAALQAGYKWTNKFITSAEPSNAGQLSAQNQIAMPTLATTLQRVVGAEAAVKYAVQTTNGGELSAADLLSNLRELGANIKQFIGGEAGLFSDQTAGVRDELLRIGLNAWRGELSRDEEREVSPYRDAAMELVTKGKFSCVVFGHTHLPKREVIPLEGRSAIYINTGTWTDTMQVPLSLLEPGATASADFRSFLSDLKENRLEKYLERRLSYADITLDNDRVVSAELKHYEIPE